MKKKLFVFFLLTIIISSVISTTTVMILLRRSFKKDISNTLKSIAYSIDRSINDDESIDYEQEAAFYSQKFSINDIDVRITFIDDQGVVLGESSKNADLLDNHAAREEVAMALSHGHGSSIRYSDTVGFDMIYTAIKSSHGNIIRVAVPLKNLFAVNPLIYTFAVFSAIAAILISMILAYLITGHIAKPINEFAKTSLEIYEGNLDKRVDIKADKNELGTLAFVFNNMAHKLQQTIHELKDDNIKISAIIDSMQDGLLFVGDDYQIKLINSSMKSFFGVDEKDACTQKPLIDVIRNRRLNQLVDQAIRSDKYLGEEIKIPYETKDLMFRIYTTPITSSNRNLPGVILIMQDITEKKKLEQIRSDFVSNVTHEMKTPLTSIRGFIETLKNGAINDKSSATRFLDIIDIESSRLFTLINDILTISEIEQGITEISKKEQNLKSLIDSIFPTLITQAQKKNISLINDISTDINLITDSVKLSQILTNLIENAIKYNNDSGEVIIRSSLTKGLIQISVTDNGIGIDDEHIDRIFERFYRVDKGRSREEGSTGLGLSIAKHLTRLLGGDIKVKSEPGSGSIFTVILPAKLT